MSLSRKYRRAMERKLLKDKDTHDLVSAMYYIIGLALKQEYGFGATRVTRIYQNIDNQLEK